jgi:hypothetical protein
MASFRITALPGEQFFGLFGLSDVELAARRARRVVATSNPGYPCRVSLMDAEIGEHLVLLPFVHQSADSPYRASGPIYVREQAVQAHPAVGEVPLVVRRRLLSVRAYDTAGMMLDAEVAEGRDLEAVVERLFSADGVAYLHVHNAKPGCYSCRIDRA